MRIFIHEPRHTYDRVELVFVNTKGQYRQFIGTKQCAVFADIEWQLENRIDYTCDPPSKFWEEIKF